MVEPWAIPLLDWLAARFTVIPSRDVCNMGKGVGIVSVSAPHHLRIMLWWYHIII